MSKQKLPASTIVPSERLRLLDIVEEELLAWLQKMLDTAAGAAIHGARMAGEALAMPGEEDAPGAWVLVGMSPDGRNCQDCLNLHGLPMTYGQFLDVKYTTRCGGNCRCGFAQGAARGEAIAPLTKAEITAALEA